MPKITFKAGDIYPNKLSKLSQSVDAVTKKAVYQGAKVIADAMKQEICNIPEDTFHRLKDGESFRGASKTQKLSLIRGFGISKMDQDNRGNWNVKLGFDGYAEGTASKQYPEGVPVPLLARSVESGTSVRSRYPFVRKAVNATRLEVIRTMGQVIDSEISKIMKK